MLRITSTCTWDVVALLLILILLILIDDGHTRAELL